MNATMMNHHAETSLWGNAIVMKASIETASEQLVIMMSQYLAAHVSMTSQ